MKKHFAFLIICCAAASAQAAITGGTNTGRTGRTGRPTTLAATFAASAAPTATMAAPTAISAPAQSPATAQTAAVIPADSAQRTECMNRNSGVRGDTFVWAAANSASDNFYSLTEDMKTPSNNICWVRVDLTSDDPRVAMTNVKAKYFPVGGNVTCGSWANEEDLKLKILSAKKTGRTWGTIGGAVGGAALGVGAMELFGNRLIGGKVMGQKSLDEERLLYSHMTEAERKQYASLNQELSDLCAQLKTSGGSSEYCD